ncbi:bifunctional 2-polyprenyl-6-hydroxyphenol methylase/3-demethylubiquinol 3-O-methyltransferase UbiG [Maridesulfovibrio ferrireducens]|uniref:class I SAM-dependent methyltransferase n=1 Tax=Maridesulfovibrio ferrireducens TaxID=246191 RepID=UPI001A1A4537|nr:class I SAM-dependent methyltransferase [Maridesulfovibrio ferrireducens]MBI9109631.1 class I SAM-dependent methyltransferase [Maridesulfovibrio ferrireducens]
MSDKKSWKEHEGTVLHSVDGFDVIDCELCGFNHIIPIPDEDKLRESYKHDYHVKEKPLMLEHQLEDKEWLDSINDARLATLEKISNGTGSFLDIGSGNGFLLGQAKKRGWTVKGIEPSDKAAQYSCSQGLDVECAVFDQECADRLSQFDVVHLGDVLEHVPYPRAILDLCNQVLRPGGLIAIGVPNDYTPVQKILSEDMSTRPWWINPPHHINYFNKKSLEGLLSRCGFTTCHSEVSFPMELFLLMGKNYLDDPKLGRECHAMRKQLERNLTKSGNRDFLDKIYGCFAEAEMGRTILVIAQKKTEQE